MEDGRYSNFIKEHEYRMMYRGENDVVLIDEDRCGFICDRNQFSEDFEPLNV